VAHSKAKVSTVKPADGWRRSRGLSPDFPLFPLGDKDQPERLRWAKKVRGRLRYFGKVADDPKGQRALELWNEQKDYLLAGREPRAKSAGLTLRELCNKFLNSKRTDVDLGKLSPRTFVEYSRTTDLLIAAFGRDRAIIDLGPANFEKLYATLAKKHGLTTLGREVTMVRSVFKYGVESDLFDRAVKFGPRFKSPSKADKRKHKARQKREHGAKLFEAAEIRQMIKAAGPQLKAMFYLGINCGFGNSDCATLPLSAMDLDGGWLDFPRPKTGIERRVPLWPETVTAIKAVLDKRIKPRVSQHSKLVFLTRLGQPWVRYGLSETKDEEGKLNITGRADDAIAKSTAKLLTSLGFKRRGLSFYTLRHCFETIAGGTADQVAVDAIMGHVDSTMAAEYREHVDDSRLKAVVDHVHAWLYATTAAPDGGAGIGDDDEQDVVPATKPRAAKRRRDEKTTAEVYQLRIVG
jgi:integrase